MINDLWRLYASLLTVVSFLFFLRQGPGGPGRGNFKYTQGVRNQQPGAPNMPPQQQQPQQQQQQGPGGPQQTMPVPGPQASVR